MANERGTILIATLFANLALFCSALPADVIREAIDSASGGLPFLQFSDGGVRVNFGGYHAEAGLGGLLGGSKAGGGLHASAGTPFGAQAAAGLGGLLNGNNANTGGGLYARAGLGNGRPEARAGLGGVLDGSGASDQPIAGGLFAGASTGQVSTDVGKSGVLFSTSKRDEATAAANAEAAAAAAAASSKPANGHTNIQIIAKSKNRKAEREAANSRTPSSSSAFFPPLNAPSPVGGTKSTEKNEKVDEEAAEGDVEGNVATAAGDNSNVVYQKGSANAPPASAGFEAGVYSRANAEAAGASDVTVVETKYPKDGKLFDDIFNIPISTLTAVNQLLRNNAG